MVLTHENIYTPSMDSNIVSNNTDNLKLRITVRPFVSEISSLKCKRILFHSITDIDATTGRTANQRAVLKSGENFLQDSIDRLDGFFGPIDQNLEKIQGTSFSYLSQRNLLENEKIHFSSTVQTTPYLLQVDFDCEG
ncbi:hypothetical protein PV325_003632 [Microctonus aethiopoides]|nr:hypothetical protein PV325_003632 [Microctonus aethiopoides]